MEYYLLDNAEYVALIRSVAAIAQGFVIESISDLLVELTTAELDTDTCLFKVHHTTMEKVAIVNMCDMACIQHRDSGGELDYAMLGRYSMEILNRILQDINNCYH
jgi:hypothetical protein